MIYDSDIPEVEHDGINATIKTLKTNTLCIETNEDETIDLLRKRLIIGLSRISTSDNNNKLNKLIH